MAVYHPEYGLYIAIYIAITAVYIAIYSCICCYIQLYRLIAIYSCILLYTAVYNACFKNSVSLQPVIAVYSENTANIQCIHTHLFKVLFVLQSNFLLDIYDVMHVKQ